MSAELDQILALAARASPVSNHYSSASSSSVQYGSCNDNPNNCQPSELAPPLPLDQYRLNQDSNPEIIRKKPIEHVAYTQNVYDRYFFSYSLYFFVRFI